VDLPAPEFSLESGEGDVGSEQAPMVECLDECLLRLASEFLVLFVRRGYFSVYYGCFEGDLRIERLRVATPMWSLMNLSIISPASPDARTGSWSLSIDRCSTPTPGR
jgi:hypothetical protein